MIIQNHGRRFTPDDALELHAASRNWLADRLAEPSAGKTVVVTHHSPSSRSVPPRFVRDMLPPAFAGNLEGLMGGERATLWIHGHTHDPFDYDVYGTRVVCNPRGYSPFELPPGFKPNRIIEI